jgi:hypothetical protein
MVALKHSSEAVMMVTPFSTRIVNSYKEGVKLDWWIVLLPFVSPRGEPQQGTAAESEPS